jgi:DNA processing protein
MDETSWLLQRRLAAVARAGPSAPQLAQLAALAPTLKALDDAGARALQAHGLTTRMASLLARPDEAAIDADLRWIAASGASLLAATDARYPSLLRESPDAPGVLYVLGHVGALADPQIAMVGSRSCTAGGRDSARKFAAWFAQAGLTVTSGLALGIDTASHEGALQAGGASIAVLGCGLDICYPRENQRLFERIVQEGAVVSEFPPGTEPRPALFPQRNRIIAGLSSGTLVVEAASRSGSLITARLAGTAGREVFALPGSIHNEMARGCHELIRQGAKLVEKPEDVLFELKISLSAQILAASPPNPSCGPLLDKEYKILLDALAFEPASVDTLIERTGLNSESIASMLLILELDGHVAPHPGGRYSRLATA